MVHLGGIYQIWFLKNLKRKGTKWKQSGFQEKSAEIVNYSFGGKVDFFSIRNWLLKVFLLDPNGGVFVNYINDLSKMINERFYLNGMQGINKQCSRTCSARGQAVQQPGILPRAKQSTVLQSSRLNRRHSRLAPHRSSRLKEAEPKIL